MVAEKPYHVLCEKVMSIHLHVTFMDCPPLDYLLVPGGEGTSTEVDNQALVQFGAEYYPSVTLYGGFHMRDQAPQYLKKRA